MDVLQPAFSVILYAFPASRVIFSMAVDQGGCPWSTTQSKIKCKESSRSKFGIVLLATGGLLISFSGSAAQDYPVSGVWVATNSGHFPGTIMGACFALKTFGLDGVLHQPFPELMIFSGSKRFEVRDDVR
jgi:hypothetical protein